VVSPGNASTGGLLPARGSRPAPLFWDPDLATGHGQIDGQHLRIFQVCNGLIEAASRGQGTEEVALALGSVSREAAAHFNLEEDLMARSGYPGLMDHREAHHELRAQVETMLDQFRDEGIDAMDLLHFMAHWLECHVRTQDQPMAEFLRAQQPIPVGAGPA
jgi:hemerythrin-like metal-binding protein